MFDSTFKSQSEKESAYKSAKKFNDLERFLAMIPNLTADQTKLRNAFYHLDRQRSGEDRIKDSAIIPNLHLMNYDEHIAIFAINQLDDYLTNIRIERMREQTKGA